MSNLLTCSSCHCKRPVEFFIRKNKNTYYRTCHTCRSRRQQHYITSHKSPDSKPMSPKFVSSPSSKSTTMKPIMLPDAETTFSVACPPVVDYNQNDFNIISSPNETIAEINSNSESPNNEFESTFMPVATISEIPATFPIEASGYYDVTSELLNPNNRGISANGIDVQLRPCSSSLMNDERYNQLIMVPTGTLSERYSGTVPSCFIDTF
ncbi:hypothetical protein WA158_004401 [Blastocystis sp. Blastoise]